MITIDQTKMLEIQIKRLNEGYEVKKAALRARMNTLDLADGAAMASKKAALQAEYTTATDEYNAALDALLFGE